MSYIISRLLLCSWDKLKEPVVTYLLIMSERGKKLKI